MPRTLVLKDIPDRVYARLKASANANRRSISGEAIHCLQSALAPGSPGTKEKIERARIARSLLGPVKQTDRQISALKRSGRK